MRSPTDNLPNDAERSGNDGESDATMVLGSHGALDRFAVSAPETWPTPASPAGGETGRGAVQPAAAGRRATGESATAEEACDPSIEQYVADLIARGNKQRPRPAPEPRQEAAVAAEATQLLQLQEKPVQPEVPKPDRQQMARPAPEERDAMTHMRDLANMSTRSVLDAYSGHRMIAGMYDKLAVAVVSIVISFGLASFADSCGSLTFLAAVAALLVSVVWTMSFLRLARRLVNLRLAGDGPDSPDEPPAPAAS